MSCIKHNDYRNIPFTSEFQTDFYIFSNICELLAACKDKEQITKCRTIGILESINGQFILKDINNKNGISQIAVSMVYLKNTLPSIVIPFVVQLFGTLQWKGKPVVFGSIIQVINVGTALRLNNTLNSIRLHLANKKLTEESKYP